MSDYQVTTFVNGKWRQNCYLVSDIEQQTLIVDPGSNPEELSLLIKEHRLHPVAVLNTHAHYDHIGAVSWLQQKYALPFYLSGKDDKLLKQANIYKILFESKESITIPHLDKDLANEPECLVVGGLIVKVIHTPGHTAGSVCLLIGNDLFSGDTLMPNGPGRTDLPGGDKVKLEESLQKLHDLREEHVVYPGHGKPFSLREFQKKYLE